MQIRPLHLVGVVILLGQWAILHAAEAPPGPAIDAALRAPAVPPEVVLEEVRRFAEARIPRMPRADTAADWERIARQLRRDALEKFVLRGEAARWNGMELKVEWLDTISGGEGYRIRKLRFEAAPGLWIPALLYVPGTLEGKVPVSLAVNGHDPKGKAVDYKQIRCINQAKRGIIVLNLEWFGMGQLNSEEYKHARMNQLDLCGTSGVSPFYLSMKRGLDILLSQPEADPQRVAVSGLSGGGWQTIFISGLDERVTLANPVAGYSSFFTRARFSSDLGDSEQTPCDMATVLDYTHLTAMRAPRPTLLTFNSKDDCCFRADHALQPLLDATGPVYALYGAEANLRHHVNDDPGTHNYQKDNRQQFYRMLGDHFFAGRPFDRQEIACDTEVRTAEELNVPLPADNETFNTLARKLAAGLPRRMPCPDQRVQMAAWYAGQVRKLRELVRFQEYEVARSVNSERQEGGLAVSTCSLRLGRDWSVPVTDMRPASPRGTTILLADKGRKTAAGLAAALLEGGQRVVALDPFYLGESAMPERDYLYALLVGGVGERPLGIQASQVAAVARWAAATAEGRPLQVVAAGPRTSIIALVALACDPRCRATGVELHQPWASLRRVVESNMRYEEAPELFCFGLLAAFDLRDIAALVPVPRVRLVDADDAAGGEFALADQLRAALRPVAGAAAPR
jgi:hypothetical protein